MLNPHCTLIRMATNKDPDSEVIFREKAEEKGIIAQGLGTEAQTGNGEEHRWVELKKFSLWLEKYDRKGYFEDG